MAAEEGREPNGWEMLRGLNRVEAAVASLTANVVSLSTFLALQKRVEDLEEEAKERQRAQGRMWASIALAVVGSVLSIVVALSLRGLGVA